jgi:hypothetical protein
MGIVQQPALPGCEGIARKMEIADILALAVEKSAGADAIEKLVRLQQELLEREAMRDFNEAMNKCQSEMRLVRNDKDNKQTNSRYATYAALDKALRPIYTKYGFSISFSTTDCPLPEHIRMLAYVSLSGYTRLYQCDMPADGKGAKGGDVMTKTHAHGSAHMYGKRNLLKDVFNVVTGDEVDDDGNDGIEAFEDLDWIASAKDIDELKRLYFQAKAKAQRMNSSRLTRLIEEAKEKRKAELL